MAAWVWDEGTSSKSRTEMWQKPTEHAAGSVCCRNSLVVTKSDIKEYSMWRKNTNPKPGFKCGLNPGFGFAKMNAFLRAPGFLKPGLESLVHITDV